MDEVIKNICIALKEEAEAVISYTDKMIASTNMEDGSEFAQVMKEIRLDEVKHIQTLTLELTKWMAFNIKSAIEDNGFEHE